MIRRYAFLMLFLVVSVLGAVAQSKEELQRQTQELLREIESVKRDLAETQKSKKQTLGVLRTLERKIDIRNKVINNIKGEVYYVEKDIIRTYRDIDTLKQELVTLKDQYAQSVVYAYKNRSNYDFLNFLFSSNDFPDALKRLSYLKSYRTLREQKAGDILNTQKKLQDKIASLTGKRQEKTQALDEQSKQMKVLEEDKQEKDKIISQLSSQEKKLLANLKAREKQRQQVQNAISAVIRREREEAMRREREEAAKRKAADDAARKANNGAEPAAPPVAANKPVTRTPRIQSVLENTPEGLISSQKFEENRGKLPWPVDRGLISLRYGVNQVPGKTRSIDVISDGISIETEVGSPVKAIFDGEVSSVFNIGDKQTVMVKHGKYFTTYSNLQTTAVRRGAKVTAGQVIGAAGANDDGVGEVQLRVDTETSTLNPEQWIRRK